MIQETVITLISLISSINRPDSLAQQAYRAIRDAIQKSIIVHGEFYSEGELAKSMGISRTPVREALIELAREGLVEIVPQRGFRLRTIGPDERREIFALRGLLECFVVRQLAQAASEEQVAELRQLLQEQARLLDDPIEFLAVDEEFHLRMPQLAGLERTYQVMISLRGALWLLGSTALALPERAPHVLKEHLAVVDAIEAHDPDRADQAIRRHIELTARATERDEISNSGS